MNKELEQKLIDQFPTMFRDMYGDPTKTCMAWGCDVGDGWFDLIHAACVKMQAILDTDPTLDFKFAQVKEKFGGLRLYCAGDRRPIVQILNDAEAESWFVCEQCGTREDVTTKGSWLKTLCVKCRK